MKERLNLERLFRRRIEMRIQLEQQKEENLDRLAQEKNDDLQFRAEQLRLLSERDKIDQMTAEKRRRIMMEHHRAVREIMEQRIIAREMEKAKLAKEHRYDLEQQEELYVALENTMKTIFIMLMSLQAQDHRRRTAETIKRTCCRPYRFLSTRNFKRIRSCSLKHVKHLTINLYSHTK